MKGNRKKIEEKGPKEVKKKKIMSQKRSREEGRHQKVGARGWKIN
jgi:hypothetical protein